MNLPSYFEFGCGGRTLAGAGTLEKIPVLLARLKADKPFVLTDKGVAAAGLADMVTGILKEKVTVGAVADDVPPDSDVNTVNRLAAVYREKGCDAIVALGGGSVLDTAKGINILVSHNASDLMQFTGAGALKKRLKPLIAVPTTAGTGSEATLVAVIADRDQNRKLLFTSLFLLPDAAVLDPRMTVSLPPHLTSQTAMDAMSHAVESYISLAKNPLSDSHATAAISLIKKHLVRVTKNPDDEKGRLALAVGANLAGVAFSNAMVGIVHTLGHSVGSVCRVPHGVCMAILLPYGLEYNRHKRQSAISELLLFLEGADVYARTPAGERAQKAVESIRQLNRDLFEATDGAHPRWLKEIRNDKDGALKVPEERLPAIAQTALGDGSIVYNPEDMDEADALAVLRAAWEGTPLDTGRIRKGTKAPLVIRAAHRMGKGKK